MKMSKRAETALRESIQKWEGIVAGTEGDFGTKNCALCRLYYRAGTCDASCPVVRATKEEECGGTPYEKWAQLHALRWEYVPDGLRAKTPEQKRAAQAELDFLKSLLPTEDEAA